MENNNKKENQKFNILIVVLSTIASSFTIYHLGLNEGEKKYLIELLYKIPVIQHIKNKRQ